MKIPKLVMALSAFCVLTACETGPSQKGYQQRMNLSLGQTADQVSADHGQPDRIVPLDDGRELWIYKRHSTAVFNDSFTFTRSETTDTFTYIDKKGKEQTSTSTTSDTDQLPLDSYTYDSDCETRFVFGPDKRVQKVTFDGIGCRAVEMKKDQAQ
ncbi:MAG: hypothetical protein JF615_03790 [Asticcacaulis sp.]|nr:hypothetical protein [Asticcacaulis sp.]